MQGSGKEPILGVIAVILTVLFVPEPMRGSRETSVDNGVELKMKTSMKDDVIYLFTGCTSVIESII